MSKKKQEKEKQRLRELEIDRQEIASLERQLGASHNLEQEEIEFLIDYAERGLEAAEKKQPTKAAAIIGTSIGALIMGFVVVCLVLIGSKGVIALWEWLF